MAANSLGELYRQAVLEHSRHPRHFGRPGRVDREAEGNNPLCGDRLTVYLALDGERIAEAAFEGVGCAICIASASIMAERASGRPIAELRDETGRVLEAFAPGDRAEEIELAGEMAALGSVRDYPSRRKCAALPWRTLEAALQAEAFTVTTEEER